MDAAFPVEQLRPLHAELFPGPQLEGRHTASCVALTDLIPAEAAARLSECSDPDIQFGLLKNIDKVALSVRNEIRQRLLSKEPTHDHH